MSDGFELFVRHWGGVGGDKVLACIHGAGRNSEYFANIGEALAPQGIETYAPDLRGFGNSIERGLKKGDVKDPQRHLKDIVEVVAYAREAQPGKKIFMIGHSRGGDYALWFAANHPNALSGLILMGPTLVNYLRNPPALILKGLFSMAFAPGKVFRDDNVYPDAERQSPEFKFFVENPLDAPAISARTAVRLWGPLSKKSVENAKKVSVPTLVLQGEADTMVSVEGAKRILANLASKDKSLKTFPDANHWFYHVVFPKSLFEDDSVKREQVVGAVANWIVSH